MRYKYLLFFLVFATIFLLPYISADEILLKNGRIIHGKIIQQKKGTITVLVRNQIKLFLSTDTINTIQKKKITKLITTQGTTPKTTSCGYNTKHAVTLRNGNVIYGTVSGEKSQSIQLSIGKMGVINIPKIQIAGIKEESKFISLPPQKSITTRPKKIHNKPTQSSKINLTTKIEKENKINLKLTPPLVPEQIKPQLKRWLYELQRTNSKHRIRAERHLKLMGKVVVGPVIPYASRPQWLIRCAALRILAEVKHPSGIPTIFRALTDKNEVVRKVANESLTKITGWKSPYKPRSSLSSYKILAKSWEGYLKKNKILP